MIKSLKLFHKVGKTCTNVLGVVSKTEIQTRKENYLVQVTPTGRAPQIGTPEFLSRAVLLRRYTNRNNLFTCGMIILVGIVFAISGGLRPSALCLVGIGEQTFLLIICETKNGKLEGMYRTS